MLPPQMGQGAPPMGPPMQQSPQQSPLLMALLGGAGGQGGAGPSGPPGMGPGMGGPSQQDPAQMLAFLSAILGPEALAELTGGMPGTPPMTSPGGGTSGYAPRSI